MSELNGPDTTVSVASPAGVVAEGSASRPDAKVKRSGSWRTRLVILGIVLAGGAVFVWKGMPAISYMLVHVSTDDAYVTGDPTTVAARITDLVERVHVNNNDYVRRGDLLVELDRKPFEVLVAQRRSEVEQAKIDVAEMTSAVATARADLEQTKTQVRMGLAMLHQAYRNVESRQDQVRYRVASLKAEIANLRSTQTDQTLAKKEFDRAKKLVQQQTATQEELDQKAAAYESAREKVNAAVQKVQQARALLALAPNYEHPEAIPANLADTDVDVRQALAGGQQVLAQFGIPFGLLGMDPGDLGEALKRLNDGTAETWIDRVPLVRASQAKLDEAVAKLGKDFHADRADEHPDVVKAQKALEDAELQLGYTRIRAAVSGYVNRKSVSPGDHVQAGQGLFTIQPLNDVYIVANYKETQLEDLRIGQNVEIYVDAYPRHVFKGRITGFAPATGASSSLLPPENATGNFVKVVQRLPVRIDLIERNPEETPLLVGLSVEPATAIRERPEGEGAGKRLRPAGSSGLAKREETER